MCMKHKIVIENQGVEGLLALTENKGLMTIFRVSLPKSGKQKMRAYPTMLMKTKENETELCTSRSKRVKVSKKECRYTYWWPLTLFFGKMDV